MSTAAKHKPSRKAGKSVAGSDLVQSSGASRRPSSPSKSRLKNGRYEIAPTVVSQRTRGRQDLDTPIRSIRGILPSNSVDEASIKLTHFRDVFRGGPTIRITMIKHGVAATDVARIAHLMDRSKEQVSKTLGLALSTVDRKAKANETLSTEQGERVVGLAKLIGQVQTMVEESGDPEGFDAAQWLASWLERSVPALGGRCPSEYMDTAEGRDLLSQLLAMTQSGTYA